MDLLDLFNMCSFGLQDGLRALQTFELFFFLFLLFIPILWNILML